ncbi:hypothetical protein PPYR_03044 [Photinus pyralis]|uniref:Cyclin-like domain-containing protein n=3 Tax=Photinus pyralis TaxID=7054 RepID=A0A5N4A1N9_PHOPY|nr:cyclin-L2 [Photinus pyralis]KAB0791244.1 hypothetical protein PPYR_03044 [Photinus pyralis]
MGSNKSDTVAVIVKNNTKPYGKIVLSLKNQLLPDDKLETTPSQTDGLENDIETDLRIYGCELIQTAGILLKLPQVAMATGQVLLQRFYYSKSLVRHPVEQTAMACICLASKIEEAPRRVRDVINVFTHIRQVTSNKTLTPVILDNNYIQLKNQVIKAERRVLKELGFCVHIKHPHKIIVMYLQVLGYEKHQQLMQYSWNYMNDSLRTDVFVRYQPETVACACIYLTARKLKLPLPKNPAWFSLFGVTEQEIRDVSLRILRLYARSKINVDTLEKKIEELCKKYQDAKIKLRGNSGNNTPNNNSPSSPSAQKSSGAHNAWGGFISRSGSHIVPAAEKRSRSKSPSHSPVSKHHKRSKKHARSRSRTPSRNHKKGHKRRSSYSRSRSNSPHNKVARKTRDKRRSRSISNDKEVKNDRYIDRYDKHEKNDRYEKDKYSKEDRYSSGNKEERDRDRYIDKDRYDEKVERKDRHEKNDKKYEREYREDRYKEDRHSNRDEKDRYKKTKHREEDKERDRSKDKRR